MTAIPNEVSRMLASAIRRVRRLHFVRGIATVGIVWSLGAIAVMFADSRLVILDDRLRWAMSGSLFLLVLIAIVFAIVLPLGRRLDFRRMAKALDARHPEFEERFSTLVELSTADPNRAGFSHSLYSMVCRLAEADAVRLDLAKEFPPFGTLRRFAVFAFLLLALGTVIGVSPNLVGRLFVRAVAPWIDIGNLRSRDIAVKPGDTVALAGSVIRIEAAADASLRAEPTIRLSRRLGGGWTSETTEPMVGGVYETTADLAEREWRYRVNAGPAVTRHYRVSVSELPKYDSFLARVDYPAYTGFAPFVCSNEEVTAIRAIAGSRVTFELKVTEPGTVSDFRIGNAPLFEYTMVSNRASEWSLELVNRDGFRASKGRHPLVSFVDRPPTIAIESPSRELPRLPPHAKIRVEFTADDDVGVMRPEIRYSIDGTEMRVLREADEFRAADGTLRRGAANVDLSRLDLSNARNVRFDLVARDSCPPEYGGPHAATSSVISVNLECREWGPGVADLRQAAQKAKELIESAKQRLRNAENLTRQLKNEFMRKGEASEAAERRNEEAAREAREGGKRLEELMERFANDRRFAPLGEPLAKTLEEKLDPAIDRIENAQFRDREDRAVEMAAAADDLRESRKRLEELAKRLDERVKRLDAYERTKDLAERQAALAQMAQRLLEERPIDRAKLDDWNRLQDEARRRTEELLWHNRDAELYEARRKMQTASRKREELKRELDRAAHPPKDAAEERQAALRREREATESERRRRQELRNAEENQRQALQSMREAAGKRAEERQLRAANNGQGADQKAREAERLESRAAEQQQSAEDRLELAEASEATVSAQEKASDLGRRARETPQTAENSAEAMSAQQSAMDALTRELGRSRPMEKPSVRSAAQATAQAARSAADAMARLVESRAESLGLAAADESPSRESPDGEVGRPARGSRRSDDPDPFGRLCPPTTGWFKHRGAARNGFREPNLNNIPREYRDLARRYFLKLSEEDADKRK